jgi:DNA-directed RNA polymerase specialized sigma24 family protein
MAAVLEPELPLVPDSTLIDRLAQRDSTALIELERRHHGSLYAQVYGMLMDSTLADRVVRDVFSKAWFAAAQLAQKRSAWAWLRETAVELAREARHSRGRLEVRR